MNRARRRLGWAVLALLAPGGRLAAADRETVRRLLLDASRALQGHAGPLFLSYFDKNRIENFREMRANLMTLIETRTIASSVDILSIEPDDGGYVAEIDWLLQLTPAGGAGPAERRQETVTVRLEFDRRGRGKIVAIEPASFFRAL